MTRRYWILAAIVLAFGLHQDYWFWNDPSLVLGLPVGLTYHIVLCFVAAVLFAWLVRTDTDDEDVAEADGQP